MRFNQVPADQATEWINTQWHHWHQKIRPSQRQVLCYMVRIYKKPGHPKTIYDGDQETVFCLLTIFLRQQGMMLMM